MPNEEAYYPQLVIQDSECTAINFPKPPVQYEKSGYWSLTAYGNRRLLAQQQFGY